MRGVCIYQITHLCGIRPLRVQKWLKNLWNWEYFTSWEWDPYDQNVLLRGEVEDSSQCLRKIMCAVCWPQDESFSTSSFLLACFTRFWGTCTNNQKNLAKNLLWWRKIAKLKTIDHNWTTQVSFRMSEENTAGCQVIADNFHSTRKKISSLSTKALFPWNSLSKSV